MRLARVVAAASALALAATAAVVAAPAAQASAAATPLPAWQEPDPGTASHPSSPPARGFDGDGADLTDIVRATPQRDIPAAKAKGGTTYRTDPADAGAAPALKPDTKAQHASDLQLRLPLKTTATATSQGKQYATFQPGDELTLALPQGVSFSKVPVVTSSSLVDLATLDTHAQPAGTLTAKLAADDANAEIQLAAPKTSVTLSKDRRTAAIRFTSNQWGYSTSADGYYAPWLNVQSATFSKADGSNAENPGYVLNVTGLELATSKTARGGPVTVTVAGNSTNGLYRKDGYATFPAEAPAACTVGTVGATRNTSFVGGTTTVGYLPALSASITKTYLMATAAVQQLPRLTIAETAPDGWQPGTTYQIAGQVLSSSGKTLGTVQFPFPTHHPAITYLDAHLGAPSGMTVSELKPGAAQYGLTSTSQLSFTVSKTDDTTSEAVTVSGLRIAGMTPAGGGQTKALPAGSTVRITITAPGGSMTMINDASTVGCTTRQGDSQFSATPRPAAALTVTTSLPVAKTAHRIGGMNRYDTAARLAQRYAETQGGTVDAVVVANGETYKHGFDALSANYLAGQAKAPIVLTAADTLPRETAQAIRAVLNGAKSPTIYVMGKADSVSDAVVDQIRNVAAAGASGAVTVTRVAGGSRYATSVAAAEKGSGLGTVGSVSFAQGSPSYRTAFVVSGEVNADALAAGPISNALGFPVLLTSAGAVPDAVIAALKALKIKQVFVLGARDRVSTNDIAQLRAALGAGNVVKRIDGANRFDTSAQLGEFARRASSTPASKGGGLGDRSGTSAYLANGITGFPDALAVGPLAGARDGLLFTTGAKALAPEVAAALRADAGIKTVTGLGQPATVSLAAIEQAN